MIDFIGWSRAILSCAAYYYQVGLRTGMWEGKGEVVYGDDILVELIGIAGGLALIGDADALSICNKLCYVTEGSLSSL